MSNDETDFWIDRFNDYYRMAFSANGLMIEGVLNNLVLLYKVVLSYLLMLNKCENLI